MCDELIPNIYGFHVNKKDKCLRFIREKDYLVTSKDVFWLGFGMYFWDNKGNLAYWLGIKKYQEPKEEYLRVRANILIKEEEVLDLTDESIVAQIDELWNFYYTFNNEKQDQPLGVKIDKLFKFLRKWDGLKAIKGIGDYNIEQNKFDFLRCNKSYYGPQIRGKLKTIYCVRDPNIAIKRKEIGVS